MEPAVVLILTTALTGTIARRRGVPDPFLLALRLGVAAMFLLTGTVHFVGMREELIAMVPPWVPDAPFAVTATGVLEILGALGLLHPRSVPSAAAGLSVLLLAMFPANVHRALTGTDVPWDDQLPARTGLQVLFLAASGGIVALSVRRRRGQSASATTSPVRADS